jgi:hypothetical protein
LEKISDFFCSCRFCNEFLTLTLPFGVSVCKIGSHGKGRGVESGCVTNDRKMPGIEVDFGTQKGGLRLLSILSVLLLPAAGLCGRLARVLPLSCTCAKCLSADRQACQTAASGIAELLQAVHCGFDSRWEHCAYLLGDGCY